MKISVLEKYPVLIGFIGVILGSIIVGFYQNKLYKSQRLDKRIEKKEQILEEAYRVYSKMPEIQFWQTEKKITAKDSITALNQLNDFERTRNSIISKQFSDCLSVSKMIELYFCEETKTLVKQTIIQKKDWWNIPPEQFNAITDAMIQEIKNDIKND